jgi:tRNA nucleotidyltransferase/poly(A) polymerase
LRDALLHRFPALARLPAGSYVVGGAIRDLLLGRQPADADIAAVDALAAAQSLGRKVITLGTLEHLRAYRVAAGDEIYDVAELLRGSIDVDLTRRDFTANAMAVDLATGELLDPNGGRRDIEARIVRMVDPVNFDDDPLRLLKGVRLAVKYGFTIEPVTMAAMRERAGRILDVSVERVTYELTSIFSCNALNRAIALLHENALDVPLFGRELTRQFDADDVSLAGSLALLIDDPRAYAERWRWSDSLLREVLLLQQLAAAEGDLRIALYDAGESVAVQLPAVLRALGRDDRVPMPDFSIRALLNGGEIVALAAIEPGKELGDLKRALLEAQIRGEVTTREEAEAFVRDRAR